MTTERPIIEIRNLVKAYSVVPVLRKLNMTIQHGEFVALLGPNGSGKSTLLRLLAGLGKTTGGTIHIGGWELPREAAAVRAQIGMVSHKPLLYDNLTASENLNFFARLYNLSPGDSEKRSSELLDRVGLARRAGDPVRTFSRGMQQRLSIARALLHRPHVLFMDEPYTGLDQDASLMLDDLLQNAHAEGHTILMATHQLDRAAQLASRVIILSRGNIGFDAPTTGLDSRQLAAYYTDITNMAAAR